MPITQPHTRTWALEHLAEPLLLRDLAGHAHLSERTFIRRFIAETGLPPMKWLQLARINHAKQPLERSDATNRHDRPPQRSRHGGQLPHTLHPALRTDPVGIPRHVLLRRCRTGVAGAADVSWSLTFRGGSAGQAPPGKPCGPCVPGPGRALAGGRGRNCRR
ncbi:helix-turn-helix domain-containing protein [Streptomyces sp. NPDC097640]|uniref:helix-turn-helix domain-containing protein n=1 Tax=Streptomyces sp. NPDC097640 TaxID=3157229 RepID=UPI0033201532